VNGMTYEQCQGLEAALRETLAMYLDDAENSSDDQVRRVSKQKASSIRLALSHLHAWSYHTYGEPYPEDTP